jgi:hypothetical protein
MIFPEDEPFEEPPKGNLQLLRHCGSVMSIIIVSLTNGPIADGGNTMLKAALSDRSIIS